jgi:hypothetical protein
VSKVAAPMVWLLDASTRLVFRPLGRSTGSDSAVTEEEINRINGLEGRYGLLASLQSPGSMRRREPTDRMPGYPKRSTPEPNRVSPSYPVEEGHDCVGFGVNLDERNIP